MNISKELYDKLRPYQKEGFKFLVDCQNSHGAINADDMGMGKTIQTLMATAELQAFPLLVVAPTFALYVWKIQCQEWLGMDSMIYTGDVSKAKRDKIWKEYIESGCKILIITYGMLTEIALRSGTPLKIDSKPYQPTGTYQWGLVVYDEFHLGGLMNEKNKTYKVAKQLAPAVRKYPMLLSGTPMRKGVIDLYAPLSLIHPQRFKSYWQFVSNWCVTIKTPFGKEIERNPADINRFRTMLSSYMLRRKKTEHASELPPKQRIPLLVEMTPDQRDVYDRLADEAILFLEGSDEPLLAVSEMTLIMRHRMLAVAPQVYGLPFRGAAIDALVEHSALTLGNDEPVVIFTPFKQAIPYIEQALRDEYDSIEVYKIHGGMSAEAFGSQWMGFQNSKKPCRVLICVIKSGASFPAHAASIAYFLGFEWDFTLNVQSEDRLWRDGQGKNVTIFYVLNKDTRDEQILATLDEKTLAANLTIGTAREYAKARRAYRKK